MEARLPKEVSPDVAVENSSADSLSFAGLVCIKDQHSKPPATNGANQINQQDTEFEFSCATPDSTTNHNPNNNSSADLLVSGVHSKCSATPASGGNKKTRDNNPGFMEVSDKPNHHEVRNQARRTASSLWFGRKMFQTLVSPCRECHAVKPSMKAQIVAPENVKSR